MEKQQTIRSLAPGLWENLKSTLKNECARVSQTLGRTELAVEEDREVEMSITNLLTGHTVWLTYEPEVPYVLVEVGGKSGQLEFHLSPSGTAVQFVQDNIPRAIPTIVTNIIRRIL